MPKTMWIAKRTTKDIWGRKTVRYFHDINHFPMGGTFCELTLHIEEAKRFTSKKSATQTVWETGNLNKDWSFERVIV